MITPRYHVFTDCISFVTDSGVSTGDLLKAHPGQPFGAVQDGALVGGQDLDYRVLAGAHHGVDVVVAPGRRVVEEHHPAHRRLDPESHGVFRAGMPEVPDAGELLGPVLRVVDQDVDSVGEFQRGFVPLSETGWSRTHRGRAVVG